MVYKTVTQRSNGFRVTETEWNELIDNFNALNVFFREQLPIAGGMAPLSGINAASLSLVESSGAGTAKPVIYQLAFDDTTDEGRMWVFRMPRGFGVTAKVKGSYKMASANTDKDVVLVAQLAAVSDGDTSHSAKVFDSANSSTERVPDAADTSDEFSITLTNDDSLAADDWVCVVLYRDADNGSDNASGDFQLTSLAVDFDLAT
jgi:hypothetical protein